MADHVPISRPRRERPEFVLSVWRDSCGSWQCRLKSLRDGTEQRLEDISELPRFLREWSALEDNHAQA